MTEEELRELGRRAITTCIWRTSKDRIRGIKSLPDRHRRTYRQLCPDVWRQVGGPISKDTACSPGFIPDFSDPATLGCLLALVRDLYGDLTAHTEKAGDFWHCWVGGNMYAGTSEIEALIVALEAREQA